MYQSIGTNLCHVENRWNMCFVHSESLWIHWNHQPYFRCSHFCVNGGKLMHPKMPIIQIALSEVHSQTKDFFFSNLNMYVCSGNCIVLFIFE